eukprot:g3107.t1
MDLASMVEVDMVEPLRVDTAAGWVLKLGGNCLRTKTRTFGTLVCMGAPVGLQFSIDMSRRWTTGEKFKGMKMIPPTTRSRDDAPSTALHLVTFATSEKSPVITGTFVTFESGDIRVWEWDAKTEMLDPATEGEATSSIRKRVRAMRFDSELAPYPIEQETKWKQLTSFVDTRVLKRCGIGVGTRILPGDPDVTAKSDASSNAVTPFFESASRAARFTPVHDAKPEKALTGAELTAFHLDATMRLSILFERDTFFGPMDAAPRQFLGELQLAFVLLLCLSSMQGLEQWKIMIKTVCDCDRALADPKLRDFFLDFLDVLQVQSSCVPADFFVDPLSSNNFLVECLRNFRRNLSDFAASHPTESSDLQRRFRAFEVFFRGHFKRSLSDTISGRDDDETPTRVIATKSTSPGVRSVKKTSAAGSRMAWMLPPPEVSDDDAGGKD